ncbi:GGDEF domain-containing protein [Rhizobium lusitanum]|uniref:GGDEF domain-containing protein n=1 Tax=Rhizobium lusitanum TaxID=293958 RepID=UPI00195E75F3|nr:GGDEF domain-containing protein [Rhizobium lusitanum]MBM7049217.1 GGDEF domain-containing protein [Rhizobium lusitanum]
MNPSQSTVAMSLIAPGMFLVFSLVFCCAWLVERRRHYLLLLSLSCTLFCAGATVQIFHLPDAVYLNAVVSSVFYTSAVIAATEGILGRSRKQFGLRADVALLLGITGMILFFCYVTPYLLARIYIQNFGYGAILLIASFRLVPQRRTRPVDRVLFWVMFVFAVQFFPRTALTAGPNAVFSARNFGQSPFWQALQVSIALLGAALAFAILAAALSDLLDDLRRERDSDPLTGVLNRRGFQERSNELGLSASSASVSLVLCDLDHFKVINDTYGHPAGDDVLRSFGAILVSELRSSDLVCRVGGEEFAILMPDTKEESAAAVAERIRKRIERQTFDRIPVSHRVTSSFGVAERRSGESLHDLMERADQLLYKAKSGGRNRLARAVEEDTPAANSSLLTAPPSARFQEGSPASSHIEWAAVSQWGQEKNRSQS